MNRRGFLGLLAGAVLDPERLLWVPGKKLISIPTASDTLTAQVEVVAYLNKCYEEAARQDANAFDRQLLGMPYYQINEYNDLPYMGLSRNSCPTPRTHV